MDQSQIDRLKAYILNVELFIDTIRRGSVSDESAKRIIDLATSYLSDAKYYFNRGDYYTSLSCIAYAEGLLDALKHLGYVRDVEWRPLSQLTKRPRVLVAGSFEFLHPGHIALLREAWRLGEVYVVVSRDENFEKFKGRKPVLGEEDRLEIVREVRYVSNAILGDRVDFLKPVEYVKPDYVLLGPDQWIDQGVLERELVKRGLVNTRVLRLEKRIGQWSSSNIYSLLREKICH